MSQHSPHSPFVTGLRCLRCGQFYAPGEIDYVCGCRPNVGSDLGTLDVQYDYAAINQATSPAQIAADPDRAIGRWWPLLPIAHRGHLPPLPVGNTPLLHAKRLGESIGFPNLYLKDDGRNPSASFKDRASAIAVTRAQEAGSAIVATASTGNAAAALAGQAAAAGQPTVIFVPKTAPRAKIAQLLVYGSRVLAVDGSYDDAFDLCVSACKEFGWYNRNTGYNPYMTEGKKTVSFEIAEQLGEAMMRRGEEARSEGRGAAPSQLATPDVIFVSVGDGCIIGGVHKGFKDLLALGWIERMPRIIGVQSTRSAAIATAWRDNMDVPAVVEATTRADSISVNAPRDAIKALAAVRETGGAYVLVEDEQILAAIPPLARLGAVFAEPAGATAYAGLLQAWCDGLVEPGETVVVINTGNGLKDVNAAIQATGEPQVIAPTLEAVRDVIYD
ncbi:MAG: threonine synthase [Caldilineaceae bacterium]